MGRLAGLDLVVGTRRSAVLALAIASASALITVPAHADAHVATHKTKHSTHHSVAPATTAAKGPQDGCKVTPDNASIGIRALQTELMVAGLKCSAEQWNAFTTKFKTTIKADADRMQHLFSKSYGKSGGNQMNAFVTQLANDASQRSNAYSEADYCKLQDVLFKKVLALTGAELERFSVGRNLAVSAPVALCTPDPIDTGAPVTTTASAGGVATTATATTVAVSTTPAPAATPVSAKR
jgi:hypothetical protein